MLLFRNIEVSEADAVEEWGFEGLLTVIDRGGLPQWRRIGLAIRNDPWGKVATELEEALDAAEDAGAKALLQKALDNARKTDNERFGQQFSTLLHEADMTQAEAAAYLGTSRTRVNSYCTGAVNPSAILVSHLRRLIAARQTCLFEVALGTSLEELQQCYISARCQP